MLRLAFHDARCWKRGGSAFCTAYTSPATRVSGVPGSDQRHRARRPDQRRDDALGLAGARLWRAGRDGAFDAAATARNYLLLYGSFGEGFVICDRLGSTLEAGTPPSGEQPAADRPAGRAAVVPDGFRCGDPQRVPTAVDPDGGLTDDRGGSRPRATAQTPPATGSPFSPGRGESAAISPVAGRDRYPG
jgi:hypothetical protein